MQPAVKSSRIQIQPSDEMLIEHSRSGNLEAFEEIFYRYGEPLYEYAFLLAGDRQVAEKIFLKSFLSLYRNLPHYSYKQKVLPQLFQMANLLVLREHGNGEIKNHPFSQLGNFPFEDRSLYILAKHFHLNVGTIGWILRRPSMHLIERCSELSVEEAELIESKFPGVIAFDYQAVLRSKIERLRNERKSYRFFAGALLLFVLFCSLYWQHFTRPGLLSLGKSPFAKPSQPQAPENGSGIISLQRFQKEREPFFVRSESFAEENLVMMPGHGKVLAIDYELFKSRAAAGLRILLKEETDLGRFASFNFWVRGDSTLGFPKALGLHFRNNGRLIFSKTVSPIRNEWELITIPLGKSSMLVNEIAFLFDDQTVGLQRGGRIYFDQLTMAKKPQ